MVEGESQRRQWKTDRDVQKERERRGKIEREREKRKERKRERENAWVRERFSQPILWFGLKMFSPKYFACPGKKFQ